MNAALAAPSLARSWLCLAAVATLLAVAAALFNPAVRGLVRRRGLAPDEITLAAARDHRGPLLWLDARSAAAFARDHVPEALPLNEDAWDAQIEAVLRRWQPGTRVIVYCDSVCVASREVAVRLRRDYRLDDVWVLHGGWSAWQEALAR